MPLDLTTAVPITDTRIDPDKTSYEQVKIIKFTHNAVAKSIEVSCQYGNTESGVWVPGKLRVTRVVISDAPDLDANGDPIPGTENRYSAMVAEMPQAGDTTYQSAARKLYTYLDDNGYFAGSYVD